MKKINATAIVTGVLVTATVVNIAEASASTRPIMIGVTLDKLNVRSGPSVSYKILKTAPKGTSLEVYSEKNGWCKVKYSGVEGWVSKKYIKEKFINSPTRYLSGTRREALREKASTSGSTYGYIYEGESVKVIDYSGDYARILYKGKVHYAKSTYLKTANPTKTKYVSGVAKVKVYETASVTSKVKGEISEGSSIKAVGSQGSFYHVIYDGGRGYIEKGALGDTNPVSYGFVSGSDHVKVFGEDKKTVLGYLGIGQKIKKFNTVNGYVRIRWNGTTALIKSGSCTLSSFVPKVVNVTSLNVKESESSSSKTIATLKKDEVVNVYNKGSEWSKIKIGTKYGYVENKNILEYKFTKSSGTIPLRSSKSISSNNVVENIPNATKVIVEYYGDGWAKVKNGKKSGYVLNEHLVKSKPTASTDNSNEISSVLTKVKIIKEDVNLREKAEWGANKLGVIKKGTAVELVSKGNQWSKVKYDGKEGYVHNDYLDLSGAIENEKVLIKIIKEDVNLREKAEWGANKLGVIKKGTAVELVSKGNQWSKVKYDGKEGYVHNDYLDLVGLGQTPGEGSNSGSNDLGLSSGGDSSEDVKYLDTIDIINPTVNTRYTINSSVEVYEDARLTKLIGYLVKGASVEGIEIGAKSIKANINNKIQGYIKAEDISHRNPFAKNKQSTVKKVLNTTHEEYVDSQVGKPYMNIGDVRYYSNPKNFSLSNNEQKYQFLKINSFRNINVYELNEYLNKLNVKSGKEAIFKGKAQAFVDAARKHDIDPIYLVAHTMLETGYGNSVLAQGVVVAKDADGNPVPPTKVYNLFGIGAIDADPVGRGSKTAYTLGWTSIEKAIEGAAKWIATGVKADSSIGLKASEGYLHSKKFTHQYTLYAMRFDYIYKWHEYSTDVGWPTKISRLMSTLSYLYEGVDLVFEELEYKALPKINPLSIGLENNEVIKDSIVRSGPGEKFRELGVIEKGNIVEIKGYADDYALITYDGEDGYIMIDNLVGIKSTVDIEEALNNVIDVPHEDVGTDMNIEESVEEVSQEEIEISEKEEQIIE